jgi:hypothetical protein
VGKEKPARLLRVGVIVAITVAAVILALYYLVVNYADDYLEWVYDISTYITEGR